MKKLILIMIILPTLLYSQGWERTYENGYGRSVNQTIDGGFIITGQDEQYNLPFNSVFLIKTNSNGDTVWTKKYGGLYDDNGTSVQQTSDSGYIVAGTTSWDNIYFGIYLIRTDNAGDTLWTKTFIDGWSMGYSVEQCSDEGFIISGFRRISFTDRNVYLVKTDPNGNTVWTKSIGGTDRDCGNSVRQTTDGGYIISGDTYDYNSEHYKALLIKTDSNGDTLWTKTYCEDDNSRSYCVEQTTDEGYILTGIAGISGSHDVLLIRTNNNGDIQWMKTYGGITNDYGYSVKQTLDGGFIVSGCTYRNDAGYDVYLIKTNSLGDTLWTRTFGNIGNDYGYSLDVNTDGGFIIGGSSYSSDNDMMMIYLLRTDNKGIITSITELNAGKSHRILIKLLDLSGREILKPEENRPYIEIYSDGSTEKKVILK